MDTPLPRPVEDTARDALKRRLDADIARGLAERDAGQSLDMDRLFDALWAELDDAQPDDSGTLPSGR